MTEMVERVARALFDAENEWLRIQNGEQGEPSPDRYFKVEVAEWRMKARAVIAAMREPTDGMKGYAHHRLPDISRGQAHDVWILMMDEALTT